MGSRVPGAHAARQPGDPADGAGRVPGAELRERRVPRRDGALVRGGRARARAAALSARADRDASRSTTRARSTSATAPTIRTTTPTRSASFARSCATSTRACSALRDAWSEPRASRSRRRRRRVALRREGGRASSRGTSTGWSSTSTCSREAMGRFAKALESAGFDGGADDAQFPARRGGDAAQRGPHGARSSTSIGLDYYHPANPQHHMTILRRTERARRALRGPSGAAVRRRGRRRLPAVLPAARREGLALHADGARWPTASAASISTWRSIAIAGSARRSTCTACRAVSPTSTTRSSRRSTRCAFHTLRRRDAGAARRAARAPPPRARHARVRSGHARRLPHRRRRAARELPRGRLRARRGRARSSASRSCARSSARCSRAAFRSRTPAARASTMSIDGGVVDRLHDRGRPEGAMSWRRSAARSERGIARHHRSARPRSRRLDARSSPSRTTCAGSRSSRSRIRRAPTCSSRGASTSSRCPRIRWTCPTCTWPSTRTRRASRAWRS